MNLSLLKTEIQNFIKEQDEQEIDNLLFKGSPFSDVSAGELVDQVKARNKIKNRLSSWYTTDGIYYPAKISIEQSSSEATAKYKADLVLGNSLYDLTGGMGVDSFYFSTKIDEVTYIEKEVQLVEIAQNNFTKLRADNIICNHADSIEFIQNNNKTVDWIYLDPARRSSSNSKLFFLEDTTPNVVEHLDLLLSRCSKLMIKTSPLLDIKQGINSLKFVSEIHVISVKNEVKELLWILDKNQEEEERIYTVNFATNGTEELTFKKNEEDSIEPKIGGVKKYLYESNASILKAGAFKIITEKFPLAKLHINSHLYTSDELIDFPGKKFAVLDSFSYNKKELKKKFGKTRMNIVKRNYPESVANIRKKTTIKEGGNEFLFFTTDHQNKRIVIHCQKHKE